MRIGPMELLLVVAVIAQIAAWAVTIAALVDALRVPSDYDYRAGSKLIWILVIIFFNCIGAGIYYAVGKPRT